MAKVFTITPGLENMGAMKTGGQGSVYKGRRIGEIITAIKLLPTPIYNESADDKNFRDFQNEVEKLKKVNEKPNPNVVKIISSGLTETGNFPFIEMEYIEGPDLEELLKPPHDPVFTLKEVIKVAEQLSNALSHCHIYNVKHGDIKSNNVKYNLHTGNYVLLDFGLAIMSDEQRRTSLRQAGAVEFMAPEQNEGHMLFQTDIYSFGIVIFELLAGKVPFPLHDKGETARNSVRLAHLESLPPDVIALRKEMLPARWSEEKRNSEALIPDWLVSMLYKCLKKKPENRFSNGTNLHEYILHNSTHSSVKDQAQNQRFLPADTEKLLKEKEQLQQQVLQYKQQLQVKEGQLDELKAIVNNKVKEAIALKESPATLASTAGKKGISPTAFIILLILTTGLAIFSAYSYFNKNTQRSPTLTTNDTQKEDVNVSPPFTNGSSKEEEKKEDRPVKKENKNTPPQENDSTNNSSGNTNQDSYQQPKENSENADQQNKPQEPEKQTKPTHQYMVISKAYFYNSPDESTRRNAFVIPSNSAILTALDEQNDFIYVVFTNQLGQTSKGWISKASLQPVNE